MVRRRKEKTEVAEHQIADNKRKMYKEERKVSGLDGREHRCPES